MTNLDQYTINIEVLFKNKTSQDKAQYYIDKKVIEFANFKKEVKPDQDIQQIKENIIYQNIFNQDGIHPYYTEIFPLDIFSRDPNNQLQIKTRYVVCFDKTSTPQQTSKPDPIFNYGEMKIGDKVLIYYIYFTMEEILASIAN